MGFDQAIGLTCDSRLPSGWLHRIVLEDDLRPGQIQRLPPPEP